MSENIETLEVYCENNISETKELIMEYKLPMDYPINASNSKKENGSNNAEHSICESEENNKCEKEEDIQPVDIEDEWFEKFIVDVNLGETNVDISDIEREILDELAKIEKNSLEVKGPSLEEPNEDDKISEDKEDNGVSVAEKNHSDEEDSDSSESESEDESGQSDCENVNIFDHKPFSRMSQRELTAHLSALRAYRAKHSLDTLYPCLKCNKLFAFECDRSSHSEICLGGMGKRVQVEIDHPALDLERVRYRVQGLWGRYKSIYRCELCPYKTTVQRNMQNHFYVHSGQRPYRCEECGKSFNSANYLMKHKWRHERFYPYKCKDCDYATFSASNLKRHEDAIHDDDAILYACARCDYKTTFAFALTRHRLAHSNDCRHRCSRCPFTALTSHELKVHRLQHTRRKPFVCQLCQLRYTTRSNLKRHERSRHQEGANGFPKAKRKLPNPKSKLHRCDHCEHCFTSKKNLKQHVRHFHKEKRSKGEEAAKISTTQ